VADRDQAETLAEAVRAAAAAATPLAIRGGDSKAFYGREATGEPLDVGGHRGIVNYEPTELVVTARAGTPLAALEAALAEQGQMLPFEPPRYGDTATLGGTIACNLSGPRRPYAGAARDFVLGTRIVNGQGEILKFGGEVMKNVAGYDVSRLMTGALGTLGVLLEVSLKVLPRPEREITLVQSATVAEALERLQRWAAQPLPISASCFDGVTLHVRLSGTAGGVAAAAKTIGGEELLGADDYWTSLREQHHPFFTGERPLWRLAVAVDNPALAPPGDWLYEWGGALRWLRSEATAEQIRTSATAAGGHATLYRHGDRDDAFQRPIDGLMALHRRLKKAFDPHGILNPGRLYQDL